MGRTKRKMTSRATWTGLDSGQRGREDGVKWVHKWLDLQRVSVCGTWSCCGWSAVHAATVTRVPAVRWSPAHVTVTVLITVTHLKWDMDQTKNSCKS